MLNTKKIYLYHIVSLFLPESRCHRLKSKLLRWCGASIGQNVRICSSVKISGCGELSIGDNTWISPGTVISCSSRIEIGKNVDIGPLVYIGTGSHEIDPYGSHVAGAGYNGDIIIGDGAWLCARCTIIPSEKNSTRTIGKKCIVAAGSVVVSDPRPLTIVAGIPAKTIRNLSDSIDL